MHPPAAAEDRYTIISSDCHAGGNMAAYREYLDSHWQEEFDAWRGGYKNPFRDLQDDGRSRNWDDDRRITEMHDDGVVAEITFPNTVPPFFPTGVLISYPPTDATDIERRQVGLDAHNRWLRDWVAEHPKRRCGLPQIFLNDIERACAEVRWAADEGFRSVLLPSVPPDQGIPGLYSPVYDPLWQTFQDTGLVITQHGGSGTPDYGSDPASGLMYLLEVGFFANRNLWHLLMSGVFERFPELTYVMTEQGVAWAVDALRRMDAYHRQMVSGRVGELGFGADLVLPMKPSDYFDRNVWIGASFPSPSEAAACRQLGVHKVMWGTDYPHHEGTYPYSREALRRGFCDWSADDMHKILAVNASDVYGFDLDALAPDAAEHGPTVGELSTPLDQIPPKATSPAFHRP
ncbi:MAG: amidohydrolase [Acidimicrobiia bacterium]|nr:amidohydrolase [Acidimicrobiia bacterium]